MTTPTEVSQRFIEAYYKMYGMRMIKSKTEFCSKTGLYTSNFVLIERGERHVSLSQLCALVDNYNISPEWIFSGSGEVFRYIDNN